MEQSKLLEQLNRFTRRKHTAQEVYMFDVILCDNEVDRDGECFTKQALETLCRRFEGVTGIFDHDPRAAARQPGSLPRSLWRIRHGGQHTGRRILI